MPFAKAALLEGRQYGVGKLWSRAFQRRIDDFPEVLRSKMKQVLRSRSLPYGKENRLRVKENSY